MAAAEDPCLSDWTRITVLLPANNTAELRACVASCSELDKLCDVFVYNPAPHFSVRYYRNSDPNIPVPWLSDYVCVTSGDVNLPIMDQRLQNGLLLFQLEALQYYKYYGVGYKEIWITATIIHKVSSENVVNKFLRR